MRIALLTTGIFIGFIIFILGNSLLKKHTTLKSEINYWETSIYVGHDKLDLTPKELFNSFPNLEKYPKNKIIYYKLISKKKFNNRLIVETEVIQNSEVILIYKFYFEIDGYLKLNLIEENDRTTGQKNTIKYKEDLTVFLKTYKGFIDLYLYSDFQ